MRALRWMALASAMLLAACGGDDNGTTGPGGAQAFRADVTGDLKATLKGDARFGDVDDPDYGQVFGIEMSEATEGGVIQLIRLGSGVPANGSYTIADGLNGTPEAGEFVAAAFDADNGVPTAIFVATGGTVKVTDRSGRQLKGTFAFDAEGGLFEDPTVTLRITVTGTFTASETTQAMQITSSAIRRSR